MKECNALQRILYGSTRDSKGSINKVYKGLGGSMNGTIRLYNAQKDSKALYGD